MGMPARYRARHPPREGEEGVRDISIATTPILVAMRPLGIVCSMAAKAAVITLATLVVSGAVGMLRFAHPDRVHTGALA
jgi:hypothetical protein